MYVILDVKKNREMREKKRKYIENVINMIMDGNSNDMKQSGEDDEEHEEEWTPSARACSSPFGALGETRSNLFRQRFCLIFMAGPVALWHCP